MKWIKAFSTHERRIRCTINPQGQFLKSTQLLWKEIFNYSWKAKLIQHELIWNLIYIIFIIPVRQKLISQAILWVPLPSLLNENERNENLKTSLFFKVIQKCKKTMFKWSYLKFSVLCILVETIVVSTAPAKHWFWIIWTDFAASVTSLSVQSEIYLNWTCINFCMKFFVWVLVAIFLEINKTLISLESLLPI